MRFHTRRHEDVDINITSLIDVVLLLLIFFMVSTRFIEESKLELVLPAASQHPVDKVPDAIEIVIDKRGQFFVNDKALVNAKIQSIQQALLEVKGQTRDPMVVISADRDAPFQLAVDAMDAARLAGLYRVTFPTNVRGADDK
jgi:biopolymer transport protein ExbD